MPSKSQQMSFGGIRGAGSIGVQLVPTSGEVTSPKVRFCAPAMEFVWETTAKGGKRVSFLMGTDGEPLVVVLGGEGEGEEEGGEVDCLLQERARKQAEQEEGMIRKAAEEELDRLVRISRSTVEAMEEDSEKIKKTKDPMREAVVRSLHEATKEMERQLQALEMHDSVGRKGADNTPTSSVTQNSVPSTHTSSPPTPPPSPPSTKDDDTPCVPSSLPLTVTVTPYASTPGTAVRKLDVASVWGSGTGGSNSYGEEGSKGCNKASPPSHFSPSPPSSLSSSSSGSPLPSTGEDNKPSGDDILHIDEEPQCTANVALQIERFERLSVSSLQALKTATLERAKRRRQRDILEHLRRQVRAARRAAEDARTPLDKEEEATWREQERRAKEAEQRIREIARRAREEHRRDSMSPQPQSPSTSVFSSSNPSYSQSPTYPSNPFFSQSLLSKTPPHTNGYHTVFEHKFPHPVGDINGNLGESGSTRLDDLSNNNRTFSPLLRLPIGSISPPPCIPHCLRPPKPPTRQAIVSWFRQEELAKGAGLDALKTSVAPWFHGIVSRNEAEESLLESCVGSFLVRVSERIWGYAVSYRAADRCRHYLVEAMGGSYTFLGSQQTAHASLAALVAHHSREPITALGGEVLTKPCGQRDPLRPDYLELFVDTQYLALS